MSWNLNGYKETNLRSKNVHKLNEIKVTPLTEKHSKIREKRGNWERGREIGKRPEKLGKKLETQILVFPLPPDS